MFCPKCSKGAGEAAFEELKSMCLVLFWERIN